MWLISLGWAKCPILIEAKPLLVRVFLPLPLNGMLVYQSPFPPSTRWINSCFNSYGNRCTVRVNCLPRYNDFSQGSNICCIHLISSVISINIHELTAALPVSRKEHCWPANEPLRSIRNPLVRIWWLDLSVTGWGELASHVCWDLASSECTHWGENISRGGVGSRGRGSLTNVTSCKTKKLDLGLMPRCLHLCSANLLQVFCSHNW